MAVMATAARIGWALASPFLALDAKDVCGRGDNRKRQMTFPHLEVLHLVGGAPLRPGARFAKTIFFHTR